MSTAYNVIVFSFALTGLILGIVALTKIPKMQKDCVTSQNFAQTFAKAVPAINKALPSGLGPQNILKDPLAFSACENSQLDWNPNGSMCPSGEFDWTGKKGACGRYMKNYAGQGRSFSWFKEAPFNTNEPKGIRTPERVAHCLESPGCEVAVMSPGSSSDSGACISRVAHKAPLFSTPPGYTPLPWDQNNST